MAVLNDTLEWVRLAIADFETNTLHGHIVIEFRSGVAVLAEKKVATKLQEQWPSSIKSQGATHGRPEYRNR
jgi:hypothetical protein